LIWQCTIDCGDSGGGAECIADCANSHIEAKQDFLLWAECVDYNCASKC
jgi:hypothetical protein